MSDLDQPTPEQSATASQDNAPAGLQETAEAPREVTPLTAVPGYSLARYGRHVRRYEVLNPYGEVVGEVKGSYFERQGVVDGVTLPGEAMSEEAMAELVVRHYRARRLPEDQRDPVWIEVGPGSVATIYGTVKGKDTPDHRAAKGRGSFMWKPSIGAWQTGSKWRPETRRRNLGEVLAEFARQDRYVVVRDAGDTGPLPGDLPSLQAIRKEITREELRAGEPGSESHQRMLEETAALRVERDLLVVDEVQYRRSPLKLTDQDLADESAELTRLQEQAGYPADSPLAQIVAFRATLLATETFRREEARRAREALAVLDQLGALRAAATLDPERPSADSQLPTGAGVSTGNDPEGPSAAHPAGGSVLASATDVAATHRETSDAEDEQARPAGPGVLGDVPAGGPRGAGQRAGTGGVLPGPGDAGHGGDRADSGRPAAAAPGRAASGSEGEREGAGRGDGLRGADLAAEGAGDGAPGDVATPGSRAAGQGDLVPRGEAERAAANLAALETLRALQQDDRPATEDEQQTLALWSGWGALPRIFEPRPVRAAAGSDAAHERAVTRWERVAEVRDRVRELLTKDEWNSARTNTLNAHYTDPQLVEAIWGAVRTMGFDGGSVLEPGSGSGNFIAAAPQDTSEPVWMTGVELDPTTAAISQYRFPDAEIVNSGFEDLRVPSATYKAVVGNVPFGKFQPYDEVHNPDRKLSIHDLFILKGLASLEPGGVLAVITSRFTLDAKQERADDGRPTAREQMYELGDLVGAVRLPARAHLATAGTDVVTDVVFLRRRKASEERGDDAWLRTEERVLPGHDEPVRVNAYFDQHPEHVLGELRTRLGQFGPEPTVDGAGLDVAARLTEVAQDITREAFENGRGTGGSAGERARTLLRAAQGVPDGSLDLDENGEPTIVEDGLVVPLEVHPDQRGRLIQLITLKQMVNGLYEAEAATDIAGETPRLYALRKELRETYRAYRKKNPSLAKPRQNRIFTPKEAKERQLAEGLASVPDAWKWETAFALIDDDPDAKLLFGLETWDEDSKRATEQKVLTRRVLEPRVLPDRAATPEDAVALAMEHDGGVLRMSRVAWLLSVDEAEAALQLGPLAFRDPEQKGAWEPRTRYLSGNVRDKLQAAIKAAGDDPSYAANVAALQQVQPDDLTPAEIKAKLGAPWIPVDVYEQFLHDLGLPAAKVVHIGGAIWEVKGADRPTEIARKDWGTEKRSTGELVTAMLRQTDSTIKVTFKDRDGNVFVDETATAEAAEKVKQLREAWEDWVWLDEGRSERLARIYNHTFNNLVLPEYSNAPLTLPGVIEDWEMRPHQNQAIRQILAQPTNLLAHVVGAGKTATMAAGAMELRRTGMATKPLFVVPNHMLKQWTREFSQLYPNAKLLAISASDLGVKRRARFMAQIAGGEWDAVIITHEALVRVPLRPETIKSYMDKEIDTLRKQLDAAVEAGMHDRTVKQIENSLTNAEARLKEQIAKTQGVGVFLEDTGVDYLFIDESHEFKNLRTISAIPGAGIDGADKATKVHMILDMLREKSDTGRIATLATGTPVANSVTEAYVLMRYLAPDLLKDMGLEAFDAWAATFGEVVSSLEPDPKGGGYRFKARFSRFYNVPEMMKVYHTFADVQMAEDLNLPVPNIRVVKVDQRGEVNLVPTTRAQRAFLKQLKNQPWISRPGGVLKALGQGLRASLDMRLVGGLEEEGSKLADAAEQIFQIWQENKDNVYPVSKDDPTPQALPGALQLVFCDDGTPGSSAEHNTDLYADLRDKLVAKGMPREAIKFIHEAGTDAKKDKLFSDARSGKVAVLIGSTSKMGTGTNVQARAVALHHLSYPWRPADMSQRDGRAERQGNLHMPEIPGLPDDIRLIYYVTAGTFDEFRLNTLARKARFIAQIQRRDFDIREIEDIGGEAMNLGLLTALASGDPTILQHVEATAERARMQSLSRGWDRAADRQASELRTLDAYLGQADTALAAMRFTLPAAIPTTGDAFAMTLGEKAYAERDKAARVLGARLEEIARDTTLPIGQPIELGTLGGQPFHAEVNYDMHAHRQVKLRFPWGHVVPVGHRDDRGTWYAQKLTAANGRGAVQSLETFLNRLGEDTEKLAAEVEKVRERRDQVGAKLQDKDANPYRASARSLEREEMLLGRLVIVNEKAADLAERIEEAGEYVPKQHLDDLAALEAQVADYRRQIEEQHEIQRSAKEAAEAAKPVMGGGTQRPAGAATQSATAAAAVTASGAEPPLATQDGLFAPGAEQDGPPEQNAPQDEQVPLLTSLIRNAVEGPDAERAAEGADWDQAAVRDDAELLLEMRMVVAETSSYEALELDDRTGITRRYMDAWGTFITSVREGLDQHLEATQQALAVTSELNRTLDQHVYVPSENQELIDNLLADTRQHLDRLRDLSGPDPDEFDVADDGMSLEEMAAHDAAAMAGMSGGTVQVISGGGPDGPGDSVLAQFLQGVTGPLPGPPSEIAVPVPDPATDLPDFAILIRSAAPFADPQEAVQAIEGVHGDYHLWANTPVARTYLAEQDPAYPVAALEAAWIHALGYRGDDPAEVMQRYGMAVAWAQFLARALAEAAQADPVNREHLLDGADALAAFGTSVQDMVARTMASRAANQAAEQQAEVGPELAPAGQPAADQGDTTPAVDGDPVEPHLSPVEALPGFTIRVASDQDGTQHEVLSPDGQPIARLHWGFGGWRSEGEHGTTPVITPQRDPLPQQAAAAQAAHTWAFHSGLRLGPDADTPFSDEDLQAAQDQWLQLQDDVRRGGEQAFGSAAGDQTELQQLEHALTALTQAHEARTADPTPTTTRAQADALRTLPGPAAALRARLGTTPSERPLSYTLLRILQEAADQEPRLEATAAELEPEAAAEAQEPAGAEPEPGTDLVPVSSLPGFAVRITERPGDTPEHHLIAPGGYEAARLYGSRSGWHARLGNEATPLVRDLETAALQAAQMWAFEEDVEVHLYPDPGQPYATQQDLRAALSLWADLRQEMHNAAARAFTDRYGRQPELQALDRAFAALGQAGRSTGTGRIVESLRLQADALDAFIGPATALRDPLTGDAREWLSYPLMRIVQEARNQQPRLRATADQLEERRRQRQEEAKAQAEQAAGDSLEPAAAEPDHTAAPEQAQEADPDVVTGPPVLLDLGAQGDSLILRVAVDGSTRAQVLPNVGVAHLPGLGLPAVATLVGLPRPAAAADTLITNDEVEAWLGEHLPTRILAAAWNVPAVQRDLLFTIADALRDAMAPTPEDIAARVLAAASADPEMIRAAHTVDRDGFPATFLAFADDLVNRDGGEHLMWAYNLSQDGYGRLAVLASADRAYESLRQLDLPAAETQASGAASAPEAGPDPAAQAVADEQPAAVAADPQQADLEPAPAGTAEQPGREAEEDIQPDPSEGGRPDGSDTAAAPTPGDEDYVRLMLLGPAERWMANSSFAFVREANPGAAESMTAAWAAVEAVAQQPVGEHIPVFEAAAAATAAVLQWYAPPALMPQDHRDQLEQLAAAVTEAAVRQETDEAAVSTENDGQEAGPFHTPGEELITPDGPGRVVGTSPEGVLVNVSGTYELYAQEMLYRPGEEPPAPTRAEVDAEEQRREQLAQAATDEGVALKSGGRLKNLDVDAGHGLIVTDDGLTTLGWVRARLAEDGQRIEWWGQDARGGAPEDMQWHDGLPATAGIPPLRAASYVVQRHELEPDRQEGVVPSGNPRREITFTPAQVRELAVLPVPDAERPEVDWRPGEFRRYTLQAAEMRTLALAARVEAGHLGKQVPLTAASRRREKVLLRLAGTLNREANTTDRTLATIPPPGQPDPFAQFHPAEGQEAVPDVGRDTNPVATAPEPAPAPQPQPAPARVQQPPVRIVLTTGGGGVLTAQITFADWGLARPILGTSAADVPGTTLPAVTNVPLLLRPAALTDTVVSDDEVEAWLDDALPGTPLAEAWAVPEVRAGLLGTAVAAVRDSMSPSYSDLATWLVEAAAEDPALVRAAHTEELDGFAPLFEEFADRLVSDGSSEHLLWAYHGRGGYGRRLALESAGPRAHRELRALDVDSVAQADPTPATESAGRAAGAEGLPEETGQPSVPNTAGRERQHAIVLLNDYRPFSVWEFQLTIETWFGRATPNGRGWLPEYLQAMESREQMTAWVTGQLATNYGNFFRDSNDPERPGWTIERRADKTPEGLLGTRGGRERAIGLIPWDELPAWIEDGLTDDLRRELTEGAEQLQQADDSAYGAAVDRLSAATAAVLAGIAEAGQPSEQALQAARDRFAPVLDEPPAAKPHEQPMITDADLFKALGTVRVIGAADIEYNMHGSVVPGQPETLRHHLFRANRGASGYADASGTEAECLTYAMSEEAVRSAAEAVEENAAQRARAWAWLGEPDPELVATPAELDESEQLSSGLPASMAAPGGEDPAATVSTGNAQAPETGRGDRDEEAAQDTLFSMDSETDDTAAAGGASPADAGPMAADASNEVDADDGTSGTDGEVQVEEPAPPAAAAAPTTTAGTLVQPKAPKIRDIVFAGTRGREQAQVWGHTYTVSMLAGAYDVQHAATREPVAGPGVGGFIPRRDDMKRAILADAVRRGPAPEEAPATPQPQVETDAASTAASTGPEALVPSPDHSAPADEAVPAEPTPTAGAPADDVTVSRLTGDPDGAVPPGEDTPKLDTLTGAADSAEAAFAPTTRDIVFAGTGDRRRAQVWGHTYTVRTLDGVFKAEDFVTGQFVAGGTGAGASFKDQAELERGILADAVRRGPAVMGAAMEPQAEPGSLAWHEQNVARLRVLHGEARLALEQERDNGQDTAVPEALVAETHAAWIAAITARREAVEVAEGRFPYKAGDVVSIRARQGLWVVHGASQMYGLWHVRPVEAGVDDSFPEVRSTAMTLIERDGMSAPEEPATGSIAAGASATSPSYSEPGLFEVAEEPEPTQSAGDIGNGSAAEPESAPGDGPDTLEGARIHSGEDLAFAQELPASDEPLADETEHQDSDTAQLEPQGAAPGKEAMAGETGGPVPADQHLEYSEHELFDVPEEPEFPEPQDDLGRQGGYSDEELESMAEEDARQAGLNQAPANYQSIMPPVPETFSREWIAATRDRLNRAAPATDGPSLSPEDMLTLLRDEDRLSGTRRASRQEAADLAVWAVSSYMRGEHSRVLTLLAPEGMTYTRTPDGGLGDLQRLPPPPVPFSREWIAATRVTLSQAGPATDGPSLSPEDMLTLLRDEDRLSGTRRASRQEAAERAQLAIAAYVFGEHSRAFTLLVPEGMTYSRTPEGRLGDLQPIAAPALATPSGPVEDVAPAQDGKQAPVADLPAEAPAPQQLAEENTPQIKDVIEEERPAAEPEEEGKNGTAPAVETPAQQASAPAAGASQPAAATTSPTASIENAAEHQDEYREGDIWLDVNRSFADFKVALVENLPVEKAEEVIAIVDENLQSVADAAAAVAEEPEPTVGAVMEGQDTAKALQGAYIAARAHFREHLDSPEWRVLEGLMTMPTKMQAAIKEATGEQFETIAQDSRFKKFKHKTAEIAYWVGAKLASGVAKTAGFVDRVAQKLATKLAQAAADRAARYRGDLPAPAQPAAAVPAAGKEAGAAQVAVAAIGVAGVGAKSKAATPVSEQPRPPAGALLVGQSSGAEM
ncbi:DEAD/DEAH box helicase family protein [Kitasatospora kifunensis]|uniref:N12 class adenine-specific DNA methylase n=1 Tax=Kitasatospora kifunensis TaxID=58351 RepID=A0A7W7RBP9_KITKI|nr:SNF2-related protein [Kitasatospora kifunensis]MBB4929047.1 N12 class adenine-specific DNA methylase [Kitasatospora kifunensis]